MPPLGPPHPAEGPRAVLVVGAGGLLGSAVVRALRRRGVPVVAPRVPWSRPADSVAALRVAVDELLDRAGGGPWSVAWCAGAAVTASTPAQLEVELGVLAAAADHLRTASAGTPGRVFFASSAGGLYAGARGAPFDERTVPAPLAPYGHGKLRAEAVVAALASPDVGVVLGRIANLYGPGQNLAKPQGLISQLCRAHVVGQPLSVYVSLDTLRDYVFVDDCALMVLDLLDPRTTPVDGVQVKVLASQHAASVGALLGECRRVFGRRPRVVLGASPTARFQARDLRLRSVVLPSVDRHARTPLAAGIHRTLVDVTGALHATPEPRRPRRPVG
ncbi:NAD-dependent epimerase/dehydratase family protein [Cellulomonas endophytica]|uniref:NAD-dependent epimerase/dehydratase family protein n=1 Tax=Cellulomonas endophytica TaxID=2494735 RepID=UPI001F0C05F9|nr:NAD(P)-dependent oxidoreductase [Cellulomonas endophytica]